MIDYLIFGLMLMFSLAYALSLEFAEAKLRLVTEETWLWVVGGVSVTLLLCGLFVYFSTFEYWKVWLAFVCTGSFIVVRSVLKRAMHRHQHRLEMIGRGNRNQGI